MKQKYKRGTTPIGEAMFAHLIKPEEIQGKPTGKFTVMLKLAPDAAKKLKADIEAEWQKFCEDPDNAKKTMPASYSDGTKEYKDEEYFKFKMSEEIVLKDKTVIKRHVPILDAAKKEISKTLTGIGNGSKIRIHYELYPFFMTKTNAGVSLRLLAVQIVDLVEFGSQSADSYGFEVEDGYSATEDEEAPFFDSSEEDETEGDF